jgi:hypothetical protein
VAPSAVGFVAAGALFGFGEGVKVGCVATAWGRPWADHRARGGRFGAEPAINGMLGFICDTNLPLIDESHPTRA